MVDKVTYCRNPIHDPFAEVSDKVKECSSCGLMMIEIGWFESAGSEGNRQDEAAAKPGGTSPVA